MNILLFIGYLDASPSNGETMKNHLFVERYKEIYDKVIVFNVKGIKKRPWRVIRLLILSILYHNCIYFVSASYDIAKAIIKFLKIVRVHSIYYWVVGGIFHKKIISGEWPSQLYTDIKGVIVQNESMYRTLVEYGMTNVFYVSNSKRIDYLPNISNRTNDKVRFVFLSRICQTKGCDEIIESVKRLNGIGYQDKFTVDFFGNIDPGYEVFVDKISPFCNISYNGYLGLHKAESYDVLSQYDVMLFPTYWSGEGFPGIIIDSYIAGLPIIASDWNLNKEYVNHNTGIIIPPKDTESLFLVMKDVIEGKYDLHKMSIDGQLLAKQYDNRNVITKSLLLTLGAYKN